MALLLEIPLHNGKRGDIAQRYPAYSPQPTGGPHQPQPVARDRAGKNSNQPHPHCHAVQPAGTGLCHRQPISYPLLWHQATMGSKNCGFVGSLGGSIVHVSADGYGHPGTRGCLGAQCCPGLQRAGIRHPPKAPTAAAPCSAACRDYSRAPAAFISTTPPERKKKKKKWKKQLEQLPVVNTSATICHSPLQHSGPLLECCVLLDIYSTVGRRGKAGPRPPCEAEGGNTSWGPKCLREGNRALRN